MLTRNVSCEIILQFRIRVSFVRLKYDKKKRIATGIGRILTDQIRIFGEFGEIDASNYIRIQLAIEVTEVGEITTDHRSPPH